MPDVPFLPGVPSLSSFVPFAQSFLTADLIQALPLPPQFQWGIFLAGPFGIPIFPAIVADSVVAFDYRQDWAIADYPLEGGAFESYDKVQIPFMIRVRMTKGGSLLARQAFLATIELNANSTLLYDVVTPEKVYASVNIAHYDFRRTSINGVGLITADVWCLQIRVAAAAAFSATQTAPGASATNGGSVQPIPLPDSGSTPSGIAIKTFGSLPKGGL